MHFWLEPHCFYHLSHFPCHSESLQKRQLFPLPKALSSSLVNSHSSFRSSWSKPENPRVLSNHRSCRPTRLTVLEKLKDGRKVIPVEAVPGHPRRDFILNSFNRDLGKASGRTPGPTLRLFPVRALSKGREGPSTRAGAGRSARRDSLGRERDAGSRDRRSPLSSGA